MGNIGVEEEVDVVDHDVAMTRHDSDKHVTATLECFSAIGTHDLHSWYDFSRHRRRPFFAPIFSLDFLFFPTPTTQ